jgi:pyruvate kinase
MALLWGVQPIQVAKVNHTDEMTRQVDRHLQERGLAGKDDMVVICAGSPPGVAGTTNLVKVHRVGDLADAGELIDQQGRRERVGPWREA